MDEATRHSPVGGGQGEQSITAARPLEAAAEQCVLVPLGAGAPRPTSIQRCAPRTGEPGRQQERPSDPNFRFHLSSLSPGDADGAGACHKMRILNENGVGAVSRGLALSRATLLVFACLALGRAVAGEPGPVEPIESVVEPQPDKEAAIEFAAVYTGEAWRNLSGGVAVGSAYIDNLDLQLKLDGRLIGWEGVTAYFYGLYNNGHEFAAQYPGTLQGVSNIEAVPASRLYEAWIDGPVAGGSLRFGLYNLNTEFDANEVGGLFLSPSHGIGPEFAHTGVTGPSIFPVTGLALRYKRQAGPWRIQGVVIDGVPGDPDDQRRTAIHLGGADGALLVAEVGRAFGGVKTQVGLWHYTLTLPDLVDPNSSGEALARRGSGGGYALASGSLWSEEGSGRDVSAFVRVGVADERVYQTGRYLGIGLASTGPFAARPKDRVGLVTAIAENGARYRVAQVLGGHPASLREVDLELTYRAVVNDWLVLQPDLHYFINPGTDPTTSNAWTFGLRFQIAWTAAR